jgi:glycosyl transferase family 25
MELIDKIIYINLDDRTDRKDSICETLKDYSHKVLRFSAIKNIYGPIGCTMSHITVLETAIQNKWNNVLIIEDDMVWKTKNNLDKLEELIKNPYDVIVLAGADVKHDANTNKFREDNKTDNFKRHIIEKHSCNDL